MENNLGELKQRIEEKRNYIERKKIEKALLEKQLKEKIVKRDEKVSSTTFLLTMKKLLDTSSEEAREQGRQMLSDVATFAVQSVFGENTSVEVLLSYKGDDPVARVVCYTQYDYGIVEVDPAGSDGGGLADIVAMAIFVALEQINGTNNFAPFILDEPTKYVSKGELSESCAKFVKSMVVETKEQFIISSHDENLINEGHTVHRMVLNPRTGISNVIKEIVAAPDNVQKAALKEVLNQ